MDDEFPELTFHRHSIENLEYEDTNEDKNEDATNHINDIVNIDCNLYVIGWLDDFVKNCNFVFTRTDMYSIIIYKNIISRLKDITNVYFNIKDEIDYPSLHYLYYPEDFLDEIFYNRGKNNYWFKNYKEVRELLDTFETMSYTIYNYNSENQFDNSL